MRLSESGDWVRGLELPRVEEIGAEIAEFDWFGGLVWLESQTNPEMVIHSRITTYCKENDASD